MAVDSAAECRCKLSATTVKNPFSIGIISIEIAGFQLKKNKKKKVVSSCHVWDVCFDMERTRQRSTAMTLEGERVMQSRTGQSAKFGRYDRCLPKKSSTIFSRLYEYANIQ